MKYRIKNPKVEKAVRGIFTTPEAFEKELNHWSEQHFKYHAYDSQLKIEANSTESVTGCTCDLYVATSDIEEVVGYDPRKWNPYPQVIPPKEGWYRVEHDYRGVLFYRAMYWEGKNWLDLTLEKGNTRFKPWDDELEGEE